MSRVAVAVAVTAMFVLCALGSASTAHVGFDLSSRIDLTGKQPRIEIWADLDHVRGSAETVRDSIVRFTILSGGQTDCVPQEVVADRPAKRVMRTTISFACPDPPRRVILGASEALGAGRVQWAEIELPNETWDRIVIGSEPVLIDATNETPVPGWIGLAAALPIAAMAGLVLMARRRGRRTDLPGATAK